MPLLKKPGDTEQEQIRFKIKTNLLQDIRAYCDWVGFTNLSAFFEEAAEYILKKDREWDLFKKQQGANDETGNQK